jgi:hypothetical protein
MQSGVVPVLHNLKATILLVVLIISETGFAYIAQQGTRSQANNPRQKTMGVDVQLVLINFKTYNEKIAPAYEEFRKSGDTRQLVNLLRSAIAELPKVHGEKELPLITEDMLVEYIRILDGTVFYSSQGEPGDAGQKTSSYDLELFTKEILGPDLVEILCVARDRGVKPIQDMSRTQLASYLYDRSHWIEDLFAVRAEVSGGGLAPGMGELTQFFSTGELQHFSDEVSKIPPPADKKLRSEFDNLAKMQKIVGQDPSLRLAMNIR